MHAFNLAHPFVARWEGGFVNHPSDPGGATNHGISLRFLRHHGIDINGDGAIDIADVRGLTAENAARLMYKYFWHPLDLDTVPVPLAVVLYDGAVNMGASRAISQLQEAFNAACDRPLAIDGRLGPLTRGAIAVLSNREHDALAHATIDRRDAYYYQLAERSKYRPFIKGWINRTSALRSYLDILRGRRD